MKRVLLIALAAAACLLSRPAQALDFSSARGGGVSFAGGNFPDTSFEDVPYVSAEIIRGIFGGSARWEAGAQQLRWKDAAGREWAFTVDNPFVVVQGDVFNLTYPVRRGPERVYLPLHPLLRLLRNRFGLTVNTPGLPPSQASVPAAAAGSGEDVPAAPAVAPGTGRITGFSLEDDTAETVLRVQAESGAEWQGLSIPPHYIVRALGAKLAPSAPRRLSGPGRIQSVDAKQEKGLVQFTLRLRGPHDSVSLDPSPEGYRVRVIPPAPVDSASPATRGKGTVIVDAGHGGKDRGAVVKGVQEADITLAVARLLAQELTGMGYTVRLTRDEDVFKTLPERPKFASDNHGDVFVSLHCNSLAGNPSHLQNVSGFTAYILREGESEEDKTLARRENQAAEEQSGKRKTEISPLDWILLEHQLNLYGKQSEALAASIIKNFSGFEIPKYTTGAHQAGFFVLVGAYMPAVLFEMGFLTQDNDRRILASGSGQKEIARRMARAVDQFQRERAAP